MVETPNEFIQRPRRVGTTAGYQAYQLLRFVFALLPIIAGIDKFINGLTNWGQYLSIPFNVFDNANGTMIVVGIIEIIVGILTWIWPRVFAWIVALWLLLIVINLGILGHYYDIILRDVALLLSAVALARLSEDYSNWETEPYEIGPNR